MRRVRLVVGASVVVLGLTVASCSSDDPSSGGAGVADGQADHEELGCPTADPVASRDDADRTAILQYGDAPARSLDPIRRVEGNEATVLRTIYDSLLELDENGEPAPSLATSWDMVDDETMEFQLRDDVMFQDGTPFDAEAVKFNIERAQDEPSSTVANLLENIQDVRVVDDHTVQMEMSPATPGALPVTLSERPGMMVSPTAVNEAETLEAYNDAPVGTGPYVVEEPWHVMESISVRAWDGYWDEESRLLGGIDFTQLSFDQSVDGLRSGDLDLQVVEPADMSTVCGEDDLRVSVSDSDELRMFVVNPTWEPFDDIKVRQALAHAIDRETLAEVMTDGVSVPQYQWFREGQPAYDEDLDGMYAYDPDKAQQLLAEAGYDGDLEFKSEIATGVTSYIRMGEIIQAQLAEIDVTMDLQQVDRHEMTGRLYGGEGAEIKVGTSPYAIAAVRQPSERFRQYLYEDGLFNPSGEELDGLSDLVEAADASTDVDERKEFLQEANRLVTEEVYNGIPLYNNAGVTGYGDYVGGIEKGTTRENLDFKGVYITEGKTSVGERAN